MLDGDAGAEVAGSAGLVHVCDCGPGLRRRRAGRGVFYLDADGNRIADRATLARIGALAIPPAWTDVWICPDPAGHLQATGRDDRGRKQYRYHSAWTACRDEAKFSGLAGFGQALPRLRRSVDTDLRRRGLPRERVIALAVRLLDRTLMRIGNDSYAGENGSFGLTTLRARHLDVAGSQLRFSFVGKSGRQWRLNHSDRRIASAVRALQELPGQRLFRYVDEEGCNRDICSQDVNDYMREATGARFTSKHFRTWGATVAAAAALAATELPGGERARAIVFNGVLDAVARRLGNTRAVCRRCYVHPSVVEAWQDGSLARQMSAIRRRRPRPLKGLDMDESTLLRWLQRR